MAGLITEQSVAYRTPMDYFELIETFPRPGWAVCSLVRRDIDRHIDGIVYGFMDTDEMRNAFRAARGLCSEHGYLLRQNKFGNVLGIAKLYAATLDEVLAILDDPPAEAQSPSRLERLPGNGASPSNLADALEPRAECMVCAGADERETEYLRILSISLDDQRFMTAFVDSDGLCLPHLRQALRSVQVPAQRQRLVDVQRDIWARLKAAVDSFASKQNYEHIDELNREEAESWARAIAQMGGERGVFGLRRKSG
jgi:hypothetical protein